MLGNRAKNTKPELKLRRLLRNAGYPGYRLHWRKVPGHPDIAYPGRRIAIFVNGCFWHRCPLCRPSTPRANSEYWSEKFSANQARDARKLDELGSLGWTTTVVWECELRDRPDDVLARLVRLLDGPTTDRRARG